MVKEGEDGAEDSVLFFSFTTVTGRKRGSEGVSDEQAAKKTPVSVREMESGGGAVESGMAKRSEWTSVCGSFNESSQEVFKPGREVEGEAGSEVI